MTDKKNSGEGREEISIAFGPQSFEKKLFTEDMYNAKARSIWEEFGKVAIDLGKSIATRPTKTRARLGGYADVLGIEIDEGKVPAYREALIKSYPKVSNRYLQEITGEFGKFVYGANDNDSIYVNETLDLADEKATNLHEYAHTDKKNAGEAEVEVTGKAYATYIAENTYDSVVKELAEKALEGFKRTEKAELFNGFSYN